MRKLPILMCLACMVAGATNIVTIKFITLPSATATIGGNSYYVGYTGADANYLSGIDPLTGNPIEVLCDDFTDHTSVGGSSPVLDYSESIFNLSTPSAPSMSGMTVKYTYSGSPATDPYYKPTQITSETMAYEVAAILLYDYNLQFTGGNNSNAGAFNLAMWGLFDPSLLPTGGNALQTAAEGLLAGAITQQGLGALNTANQNAYGGLVVLDPTSNNPNNQEFLGYVPHSSTPEPATLSLVGAALLGLGILRKKRKAAR